MSLNINADTKILIFGDSNAGQIHNGMGRHIKNFLVSAHGATAGNIHISTNVGWKTSQLADMAASGSTNPDAFKTSDRLTTPGPFLRTGEYDIVFLSAGGNDTTNPGKWYSDYLNPGGSIDRLANIFGEKLMWIAPVPSTKQAQRYRGRGDARRSLSQAEIYRYLTIGRRGGTSIRVPSDSPVDGGERVCAAQSREIYKELIERRLGATVNGQKVTYMDVRDMRRIPDAVAQKLHHIVGGRAELVTPEVVISRFPNISDGLHVANPPPAVRPWVSAIAEWLVQQALRRDSPPSEDGAEGTAITDEGESSDSETGGASTASRRPASPNVSLRRPPCPPGTTRRLADHTSSAAPGSSGPVPPGPWGKIQAGDFSYQITGEDVLWAGRMVLGEGGPRNRDPAAVLWAQTQRFVPGARSVASPSTLWQLFRGHSQPINPTWLPDSENTKCYRRGPDRILKPQCSATKVARRREIMAKPWEQIPEPLRQIVESWATGGLTNPVPRAMDFADETQAAAAIRSRGDNAAYIVPAGFEDGTDQGSCPGRHCNYFLDNRRTRRWPDNYVRITAPTNT